MTNRYLVTVVGLVFAATSMLVSCDRNRDGYSSSTKLQYVPDMADTPVSKTQRTYLDPPAGSVATGAILYPETAVESEELLENPFPGSDYVIAKGRHLWGIFCVTCHGADAGGDHSLGDTYPRPPDLRHSAFQDRGDGYFFHVITFGNVIMPGYGHAISSVERWQIIHYLRQLQNEAAE